MSKAICDYIELSSESLEKDVFPKIVNEGKMNAFLHEGFWQCMDNVEERDYLEKLWGTGTAPWNYNKTTNEVETC